MTKKYELFSVGSNHLDEKIDVEKNKFVFEDLKDEFNASEQDAIKFQINYSIHKLTQKLNKEEL